MILWLFLAFLQIGALSFGGGYAAMPLLQSIVVDHYHWISIADFTNLVTISQMTPGPISINAATFVGEQLFGMGGAIVATLGVVIPSAIFVSILAWLYEKYTDMELLQGILKFLRPVVVAMILSAGITILMSAIFDQATKNVHWRGLIIFIVALVVLRKWKTDPIVVMIGCGVAELISQLVFYLL